MVGERDCLIDNLGSEIGIFSIKYGYKWRRSTGRLRISCLTLRILLAGSSVADFNPCPQSELCHLPLIHTKVRQKNMLATPSTSVLFLFPDFP